MVILEYLQNGEKLVMSEASPSELGNWVPAMAYYGLPLDKLFFTQ